MGNEKPISIPSMMKRNANEVPNVPALKAKDPETGKEVSCGTKYCLTLLTPRQDKFVPRGSYIALNIHF